MTILRTALRLYLAWGKVPSIGRMHDERRYCGARWASFASFKVASLATINWFMLAEPRSNATHSCYQREESHDCSVRLESP